MKRAIAMAFLAVSVFSGCAAHTTFDTSEFRDRELQYGRIALSRDGLSREQIEAIASTRPPESFPVDVCVIVLVNGYVDARTEDLFAYNVVSELGRSEKIKRVTLIPRFLVASPLSFSAIQELGVRSLSEYAVVFYIDASELFKWTKLLSTRYEISSSASFIVVDSFTSAMLASERVSSLQQYDQGLFELGEEQKAKEAIFSEQGRLLAGIIDDLFAGRR